MREAAWHVPHCSTTDAPLLPRSPLRPLPRAVSVQVQKFLDTEKAREGHILKLLQAAQVRRPEYFKCKYDSVMGRRVTLKETTKHLMWCTDAYVKIMDAHESVRKTENERIVWEGGRRDSERNSLDLRAMVAAGELPAIFCVRNMDAAVEDSTLDDNAYFACHVVLLTRYPMGTSDVPTKADAQLMHSMLSVDEADRVADVCAAWLDKFGD